MGEFYARACVGEKHALERDSPGSGTLYYRLATEDRPMKYRIAVHKSEEGYSVSVPGLPGCWSQGASEKEALENIKDAIREYLAVVDEQLRGEDVREIEVTV